MRFRGPGLSIREARYEGQGRSYVRVRKAKS
jgi:hypothetical protein